LGGGVRKEQAGMGEWRKKGRGSPPDPASVRISRLRRNPEVGTQTPGGFRPSLPSNHAQARQWHLLVIKPPEMDVIASTAYCCRIPPGTTSRRVQTSARGRRNATKRSVVRLLEEPSQQGFFSEPGRSWTSDGAAAVHIQQASHTDTVCSVA